MYPRENRLEKPAKVAAQHPEPGLKRDWVLYAGALIVLAFVVAALFLFYSALQGIAPPIPTGLPPLVPAPSAGTPSPSQPAPGLPPFPFAIPGIGPSAPSTPTFDQNRAYKGDLSAKVTILEFCNFANSDCSKAEGAVVNVLQTYGNKVRFQWRHSFPNGLNSARLAGQAFECAVDEVNPTDGQSRGWPYHDVLLSGDNYQHLTLDDLERYGLYVRVNTVPQNKFNSCLESGAKSSLVDRDNAVAAGLNIYTGPIFFVNNQRIDGVTDQAVLKAAVDKELQK